MNLLMQERGSKPRRRWSATHTVVAIAFVLAAAIGILVIVFSNPAGYVAP